MHNLPIKRHVLDQAISRGIMEPAIRAALAHGKLIYEDVDGIKKWACYGVVVVVDTVRGRLVTTYRQDASCRKERAAKPAKKQKTVFCPRRGRRYHTEAFA